jgi:hypothetical protein
MTGPGWPSERGWLTIGAWLLFVYIISLVAFIPDLDKSQLFTALASGVAGAILRDVYGMWTASTKAGSELAGKAMDALHRQSDTPAGTPNDPLTVTEQKP